MKLKFLLFTLFSFLIFNAEIYSQTRKTVTPTYVTATPTSCDSSKTTQTLYVVKNVGLYVCLNNVLTQVGAGGGGGSGSSVNTSSKSTSLAGLKAITDAAPTTSIV